MKKITITLSDAAEKYFNEVKYSLDINGNIPTDSEVINHCLENLSDFEQHEDRSVVDYLHEKGFYDSNGK